MHLGREGLLWSQRKLHAGDNLGIPSFKNEGWGILNVITRTTN
jgi:hypothetical protein